LLALLPAWVLDEKSKVRAHSSADTLFVFFTVDEFPPPPALFFFVPPFELPSSQSLGGLRRPPATPLPSFPIGLSSSFRRASQAREKRVLLRFEVEEEEFGGRGGICDSSLNEEGPSTSMVCPSIDAASKVLPVTLFLRLVVLLLCTAIDKPAACSAGIWRFHQPCRDCASLTANGKHKRRQMMRASEASAM